MNNETILYVARYIEGDMDEAERATFESRLENDAHLKQHLETYQHVHETLKHEVAPLPAQKNLEQTLDAFNKQYFKQEAKTVSLRPYIRLLSGIAAVLFIGLMIWAPWKQSLYERFSVNDPIAIAERGNTLQNDFDTGAKAYNAKDFKTAENNFAKAYKAQPENARYGYYYALTLAKNEQNNDARIILTKIYEGASVFKYEAAYAIALSYLQEKDRSAAKNWLSKIPEGNARYNAATALSKEL